MFAPMHLCFPSPHLSVPLCPAGVLRVGPVQAQGEADHAPTLPDQEGAALIIRHHREEQPPQHGVREAPPPSLQPRSQSQRCSSPIGQ